MKTTIKISEFVRLPEYSSLLHIINMMRRRWAQTNSSEELRNIYDRYLSGKIFKGVDEDHICACSYNDELNRVIVSKSFFKIDYELR